MRMSRRAFVGVLGVAVFGSAAAQAQRRAEPARVGFLSGRAAEDSVTRSFRKALSELGYEEDRNLIVEYRWAGGSPDAFRKFSQELLERKLAVIVVSSTTGALAAKRATATVPIVFVAVGDPVGAGVVSNLARPGGNVTGITHVSVDIAAKTVQLLKEAAPQVSRVAVIAPIENPTTALKLRGTQQAAASLGLKLRLLEVRGAQDFAPAFAQMEREPPQAILTLLDGLTIAHRKEIVGFALQHRLPSIYEAREFTEAGGLVSYGADFARIYRRAASYVDRILRGAKPAELPVEQADEFELVINLATAKAIGVTLPQSLVLRASHVIA